MHNSRSDISLLVQCGNRTLVMAVKHQESNGPWQTPLKIREISEKDWKLWKNWMPDGQSRLHLVSYQNAPVVFRKALDAFLTFPSFTEMSLSLPKCISTSQRFFEVPQTPHTITKTKFVPDQTQLRKSNRGFSETHYLQKVDFKSPKEIRTWR